MTQSSYSLKQEVNDIACSIGAGLLARAGANFSEHVFRTCSYLLAKEVADQRRKAFDRLSDQPKFADLDSDFLDQQHRQWVISYLFGSVINSDFKPDFVAEYQTIARNIVAKVENMITQCPELFS